MKKKKYKINIKEGIGYNLVLIFIVMIIFTFIFGTGVNKFGNFKRDELKIANGRIISKEKEVFQDVKVPEFNYYFIIEDLSNNEINKYKVNNILYNVYKENDCIKYYYYENINEIIKIDK